MPTYEYECEACGGHFEVFHSMSDPHKEKCDECGGKLVKLLSGGAGLIFKGSGFYITDYKGGSKSEQQKSESGGDKPSEGGEKSAEKKADAGDSKSASTEKPASDKPKASTFEKKKD